ncbi:DUF5666 domain-containing protein [Streptomyces aurantiogriseus]|uniref:DUF5666 domain-containing protein n=1 Tax=Streptomyces aurantiogriseus TaxID=66870 RepID=A0A918KZL3_9ACTN|nr:DUF5666 domain-containing protein [Streptomyces aurantiogriseus]GGR55919.1 hypothetical protein GCM10010251_86060 [Streptomyces aurantiogriseus]
MDDPEEVEVLSGPGGEEPERTSLRALWQRRSARGRAVIAATTVAVLALGGTVAYAATSGGSSDAAPGASPSASASQDGPGDRQGRGGPWSRFGGEGVHGEATVKDRDTGEWVVRSWQRGTVEETDGDRVTVRSEDGTSWTWTVTKDTKVFADGDSTSGADALKKGDTVYVAGSRSGDTRTAERVLSGTFEDKAPGDRRFGFPGHGPWGRDDRSPSPSGSGATT